jgi:hypothetical protein
VYGPLEVVGAVGELFALSLPPHAMADASSAAMMSLRVIS